MPIQCHKELYIPCLAYQQILSSTHLQKWCCFLPILNRLPLLQSKHWSIFVLPACILPFHVFLHRLASVKLHKIHAWSWFRNWASIPLPMIQIVPQLFLLPTCSWYSPQDHDEYRSTLNNMWLEIKVYPFGASKKKWYVRRIQSACIKTSPVHYDLQGPQNHTVIPWWCSCPLAPKNWSSSLSFTYACYINVLNTTALIGRCAADNFIGSHFCRVYYPCWNTYTCFHGYCYCCSMYITTDQIL